MIERIKSDQAVRGKGPIHANTRVGIVMKVTMFPDTPDIILLYCSPNTLVHA